MVSRMVEFDLQEIKNCVIKQLSCFLDIEDTSILYSTKSEWYSINVDNFEQNFHDSYYGNDNKVIYCHQKDEILLRTRFIDIPPFRCNHSHEYFKIDEIDDVQVSIKKTNYYGYYNKIDSIPDIRLYLRCFGKDRGIKRIRYNLKDKKPKDGSKKNIYSAIIHTNQRAGNGLGFKALQYHQYVSGEIIDTLYRFDYDIARWVDLNNIDYDYFGDLINPEDIMVMRMKFNQEKYHARNL